MARGDMYEEALAEVKSAIEFHIETSGRAVLEEEAMAQEVFTAETGVMI
jgi:predicted RNase H-like HicB family nuclease